MYGMFCTCFVLVTRKGVSNVPELSMNKLEKDQLEKLMAAWGQKNEALLSDSSSDSGDSGTEYASTKKKKKTKKSP